MSDFDFNSTLIRSDDALQGNLEMKRQRRRNGNVERSDVFMDLWNLHNQYQPGSAGKSGLYLT